MSNDVTVVVGTRPEAIKLAPVVTALRAAGLRPRLLATGQHADLLDGALAAFNMKADANLSVLRHGQSLGELTGRLVPALEAEFAAHKPALIVVQGDTTSSFAAALAAFYLRVPCVHVEAGLRSFDRAAPFPEEANREMTDRLCTRLYAPTEFSRQNLVAEGLPASSILVTGQTGVDAALHVAATLDSDPPPELRPALAQRRARVVYATGHRRENMLGGVARIARELRDAAARHDDVTVLFAAHPSPVARAELQGIAPHTHWRVLEPVSYAASLWLLREAACVVSDSGGLQEEAPCFGTPVLVTREKTERPEGIEAGFLRLVGTDPAKLRAALDAALADAGLKPRLAALPNPYGDGKAAQRIAADIKSLLGGGS